MEMSVRCCLIYVYSSMIWFEDLGIEVREISIEKETFFSSFLFGKDLSFLEKKS